MNKIIAYKFAQVQTNDDGGITQTLEDNINELISKGYQPFGNIYLGEDCRFCVQPMVKYE